MASMVLKGEVRGGTSGGKAKWVVLDKASESIIGRSTVSGKTAQGIIEDLGLQSGDQVVVEMANSRSVTSIVRSEDYDEPELDVRETVVEQAKANFESADILTPPSGMFPCVPESDPGYIIPREIVEPLAVLLEVLKVDNRVNVLLTGPQGTGKTTLGEIVAEELGWNFVKFDCGMVREPSDWWNRIVAKNGSTFAIPTQLVYAITTPNTVIVLDEINRTNPANHNAIYGLLDEKGKVWSDDLGCYVERAPGVLIIATANVGEDNIGVFPMDAALIDRLPFQFELSMPSPATMSRIIQNRVDIPKAQADALGALTDEVAKKVGITLTHHTGTRPLIAAAKMMTCGLDYTQACAYTVAATFSTDGGVDSERTIVLNLVTGIAGRLDSAINNGQEFQWTW